MSNGGDLLRMLMPAVRPVPSGGVSPAKQPIESQSFDALLQDARQVDPLNQTDQVKPAENTPPAEAPAKPDTLAPLAGLDSIHNASLRRIIAEANGK